MLVTFGPAGIEGFFTELGTHTRNPEPEVQAPDPGLFATAADRYQMDIVGPPPTLD
jgi:hypothetical protein